MGFWFKFNLSLIFNYLYFDSGMMVSNNIDNVLIIYFLTIILANLFSNILLIISITILKN